MSQPRIRITSIGGSGDGLPGDPGDSAYQVAVNNGFTGTEQQWLDSLVGAAGADGADGIDGADALWNFTGEWLNGVDYVAGDLVTFNGSLYYTATGVYSSYSPGYPGVDWVLAASKGVDGADGIDGANGIDGADGAQGPRGDQGDPGPAGADGTNGLDGEDGIGMPVGGEAGQILAKDTATDYDFIWIDNYANWTSQLKHEVKLGEAIAKGQAVYVSSADGTNMIVSKASNASESTSSKTLGLLESGGSTNAKVKVITEGLLAGLNTNGANEGDPVWLGTDGNLIYGLVNKPSAPAHLVFIGIVTRANANNGEIFVKPQNGFEVKELHDAVIDSNGSIADNEIFAYDSTSGMWKNQTAAEAGLQTRVLDVSDAEIGYLKNVTSDIQTQINEKAALLSPTITMASFASANSGVDPVTISTNNGHGGSGYAGIMTLENSGSGVTNPRKYIRLNNAGAFEIVNNAYSSTLLNLSDNGNLSITGTYNGAAIGDTGWQSVSSFSNGFGAATAVAYRKINNVVYMRGNLINGTFNTTAFTLPDGYRPSVDVVIPTQQYGTANTTYVTVNTNGNVVPNASAAWLSSIIFPIG